MRCTEIRTRDTLLIPIEEAALKKLLEVNVSIFSNKYKYMDTPSGVKLLIEGIKAYTISYIGDTKREKIITKTIKVPFCTFIPVRGNKYGYRSIEFIIDKLNVIEVDSFSIVTAISFKIICYENYIEKDSEIINSEIIDIRPIESTVKFKNEKYELNRTKKRTSFSDTYSNRNKDKNGHGFELLNYLTDQNVRMFSLVLFLLIIGLYFNHNKLR